MNKDILVTDEQFIFPRHEKQLSDAGYNVVRLKELKASEDVLISELRGKVGYILGGIETVTPKVIEAANALQAIAFTGSGVEEFIPGWKLATERGIAISAARGANANSVAEWSLAAGLTLIRNQPALSADDGPAYFISREFAALTMGIVGLGRIGSALAQRATALGIRVVATPTSREVPPLVTVLDSAGEVAKAADLLCVHVSKGRGGNALDASAIARLKAGSVVVNAAFDEAVDNDALLARVQAGELRAALDYKPTVPDGIPAGSILSSNAQTAFNTVEANERTSDRATRSLINLLSTGHDPDLVNPEYSHQR